MNSGGGQVYPSRPVPKKSQRRRWIPQQQVCGLSTKVAH